MENDLNGKPFEFESPRQREIYQRLMRLVGPGPAEFFQDACRLMASPATYRTTTHLVGHLLREVEGALRDVLGGIAESTDVSGDLLEAIRSRISDLQTHLKNAPEGPVDRRRLLKAVEEELRDLLKVVKPGVKEEVRDILRSLELAGQMDAEDRWLRLHSEPAYRLHRLAHRRNLDRPRGMDENFRRFWGEIQELFFLVLNRFEANYARVYESLDDLLDISKPTREDVRRLRETVPQNLATRSYFFSRLSSAKWLDHLRGRGFFNTPPSSVNDPNTGETRILPWPESQYLARMAKECPEEVAEIIKEAEPTDNPYVHQSYAEAAINMPGEQAARLVPLAEDWLSSPSAHLLVGDNVCQLAVHLAQEGQIQGALDLSRSLLGIVPPNADEGRTWPRVQTRIDEWQYQQAIEKLDQALGRLAPDEWMELLCDLLERAVESHLSTDRAPKPPDDRSFLWRPAIEDHAQNGPRSEVLDFLVTALRDHAKRLCGEHSDNLPDILTALEDRPWTVFRRIALHLLTVLPGVAVELAAERIGKRAYFDDAGMYHEYYRLLEARFGDLPQSDQDTILLWIEAGPKHNWDEARTDRWEYRMLLPIREVLPTAWRSRFEGYAERFGPAEHPGFLSGMSEVWVGPTSPYSTGELSALSIDDVIRTLEEWEAPEDWMAPSPEGLGRNLAQVVAADPQRFAEAAPRFANLEPTYVRAILGGLRDAVQKEQVIPWEPVLDLCRAVVRKPRALQDTPTGDDRDPHWGWARQSVAHLLSAGLSGGTQIPCAFRERVWEVLEPLTDDPDPTPKHETEYGPPNMDPVTSSINTVRGEAMHAAIRYGFWVHNNEATEREAKEPIEDGGFKRMPELRLVLERHLDPESDASLAIRAVYGQWFPQLMFLDEEWAVAHVEQIFPRDSGNVNFWEVAWGTYLWACRPNNAVLDVLRAQYAHAITRLGLEKPDMGFRGESDERLAAHLIAYYWRGLITFEDPGDLLAKFFEQAPPDLRGHAVAYVGRILANEEKVGAEVLDRLRRFWEWRFETTRESDNTASHTDELAAFVWWFRSGKFDPEWSLRHLKASVESLADVGHEAGFALDQLAELAAGHFLGAVECLGAIAVRDKKGWLIITHRDQIRVVLDAALRAGGMARSSAVELINRLVSLGYPEFRDLLGG